MKNILVTCADGFIGSYLDEKLIKKAYKVVAFCVYKSTSSWFFLDHLSIAVKIEIEVFLLYINLTGLDRIYTGLEGFKKGFSETIERFSKKENQAKYQTGIFTI